MQHWPGIVALCLICSLVLGACGSVQPQSTTNPSQDDSSSADSSATEVAATPDAAQPFAENAQIAGIDVGGMTATEASTALYDALAPLERTLTLRVASQRFAIEPAAIGAAVPIDTLVAEAQQQAATDETVRVPLEVELDTAALREQLTTIADTVQTTPTLQLITATESLSRSFVYTPGTTLDVDETIAQIEERLQAPEEPRRIDAPLRETDTAPPPVSLAQIEEQMLAMAEEWVGTVGFYLYDLQSGETITLNADSVFSGASILKVPIMLHTYISLPEFDEDQEEWMEQMIIESDNMAANSLLANSVDGWGTEDALAGVEAMNDTLRQLGFQHTYQNLPYEAGDYLINVRGFSIEGGPPQEGPPPYTDADPMVRTTPAEISQVFMMIDECSQDEGLLLEQFADSLSPERCEEMLDWLARNDDDIRMRSGLPDDLRVEHKSGWVEDMQADVGIVRSEGGDFVLAVYLFLETDWLRDPIAGPVLGDFARMVYTAYNPVNLTPEE